MYRANTTLEQWRILQAVVDHGGYAQAAAAINKSQSSMNHAVAKLQQVLGVQLLEVKGRKAQLTEQGALLLRRSRVLTNEIEQLELMAENLEQGWEPEIKISRENIYPSDWLFKALTRFYPESRGTRVVVVDNVISGTIDAIKEKRFDIVIAGKVPAGYSGTSLGTVKFVLVCAPNHPLASEEKVDESRLCQELQIVIRDTGSRANEDMGWLKAEQRWTFSNFHEALAILSQGVGFCWMPDHIAAAAIANGDIIAIETTGISGPVVPLTMIFPNSSSLGPAASCFAEHLINCASSESSD